MLGDALPELSASIQARLFAAFGLELIYNKHDRKVTICATIAPSAPKHWPRSSQAALAAPGGLALSSQHPRTTPDSHS